MSSTTIGSPRSLQLPLAAVLATMTSAIGLSRLIHPGAWAAVLLLTALVISAVGIGLRRLSTPRPVIVLAQLAATVLVLTVTLAPHYALGHVLPDPAAFRALVNQISQGGSDLRDLAPPATATPGVNALMGVSGAAFALLLDVLAVTLRRPVLAGAPMLAVYLIPATRQPGGLSWLAFAIAAIGYLTLIGTDGHDRLGQWGRAVQRNTGRASLAGPTNTGVTRRIAVWAIACALLLPLIIPATPQLLQFGPPVGGSGGGTGTGPVSIEGDVDISRDLSATTAQSLFTYRTNAPNAQDVYIQKDVLTDFDGTDWQASPNVTTLPSGNSALGVPGLSTQGVTTETVTTQFNVNGDFSFTTVPAPYSTDKVTGLKSVSINPDVGVVYAGDGNTGPRRGEQYTTVSTELDPTKQQLEVDNAPPTGPGGTDGYVNLPSSVSGLLTADAKQITQGDGTEIDKAIALQDYFQTFTYTLDPKISGYGVNAIESFLQTRAGFCEQFAATMAGMARALGIPAVVVVGFTPGTSQHDGSYLVTTHDAHAWPMLYFQGYGWIRFEPTPKIVSGGRAAAPPWTSLGSQNPSGNKSSGATTGPTAGATPAPTSSACANGHIPAPRHITLGAVTGCGSSEGSTAAAPQAFASWGPLGFAPRTFERWFLTGNPAQIAVKLLILLLVLLTCVPGAARVVRARRRRKLLKQAAVGRFPKPRLPGSRVRADDRQSERDSAEASRAAAMASGRRQLAFTAWEELREYATDLGYGWPASDTPRQLAGRLAAQAEFDGDSTEAVGRVTTLMERAVYSPEPDIDTHEAKALPGDVRQVRGALAEHAGRAARLKAAVLPSSSLDTLLRRGGGQRQTPGSHSH